MKPHARHSALVSRVLHSAVCFTRRCFTAPFERWLPAPGPSLSLSVLMLVTACGDADSEPNVSARTPSGEANPNQSASSAPTAPAAGGASMNSESIPAPALDADGAAAASPSAPTGAAADDASSAPDAAAPPPASDAPADAGAPPVSDPATDENLVFILQDGFQTTYFVSDCRSINEDGTIIEGAPGVALPVGGGYILECNLENLPSRATTDVLSASDEPWCALGELQSYEPGGDERLTITIVTPPDVSPAFLIATREGEQISLTQAAAFGALIWPVWIEATYDVNEVAPAEQGRLCDQIFGL